MRRYGSWKLGGVAGVLLLTFALSVLAGMYSSFPGDEWALVRLQGLQNGWLDTVTLAFAKVGRAPVAGIPVAAVVVSLVALRRRANAVVLSISLVPLLAGDALKDLIGRPRPDYLLIGPQSESLSFPSGHSAYALVFCGFLIYVVDKLVLLPSVRRWLQGALVALILAMGASRVYLGVHWPSDVIGGYLYGFIVLLGMSVVVRILTMPRMERFRRRISPW